MTQDPPARIGSWDHILETADLRCIPINATIELVYACNLKCVHCYQSHLPGDILTTKEVKRAIDELADMGSIYLGFTGGEPFLRKDFFELASYARKRSFDLKVLSNIILLDVDKVQKLKDLNFSSVETSVYGATPEVHDEITRTPGSFEKTWRAVDLLREQGIHVTCKMPLMKSNAQDKVALEKMTVDRGAEFVCDMHITATTAGSFAPCKKAMTTEQLYDVLPTTEYFQDFIKSGGKGRESLLCKVGRTVISVSARGDIYPCESMSMSLGNIREKSIADIWENSASVKHLRGLTDEDFEECLNCEAKKFCHRCAGHVYLETGSYLKKSESFCKTAKAKAKLYYESIGNTKEADKFAKELSNEGGFCV